MTRRSKPNVIVKKGVGGLSPVSSYDAEALDAFPQNTEFDLISRTRRSNPMNRFYWSILTDMIEATVLEDTWPSSHKLHEAILISLGYVTIAHNFDGTTRQIPDSTAFDAMDQDDFRAYFDKATALLSRLTGIDALTITRQGK
jgi:hypothetical protein